MAIDPAIRDEIVTTIPRLRAFAVSLCGKVDAADDLVQETLMRAFGNLDKFTPGTNLTAWLFTILRNHFRSEYRKRKREVEDVDGHHTDSLRSLPDQMGKIELEELRTAMAKLPDDQREALVLVGAAGFSYEEAAEICGCAVGTIKSRLSRARTHLSGLLGVESVDEFGTDAPTRGIVAGA